MPDENANENVTENAQETTQDNQDEFVQDFAEYLTTQDDESDQPLQGQEDKGVSQKKETAKTEKKKDGTDAEPDPFGFVTTNEKGETVYDSKSAFDFVTKKPEKEFTPAPPVKEPEKQQPVQDEKKPSEEEILFSNMNSSLALFRQYREMGYDEQAAAMMAERDVKADIRNHIYDKTFNDRLSKLDERDKQLTERAETLSLTPKSEANLSAEVRRGNWGNSERLTKALMDKDLGGGFLVKMFRRENPDKTYTSMTEYTKALQDWFTRFSADEESLQMAVEYAKAKIFLKHFPKLMEQSRNTKEKIDKDKKETKVKGASHKQKIASRIGVSNDTFSWMDAKT
jgi:hypothetical protein